MAAPQYYSDYLQLDHLLDLQHPVSDQPGNRPAHDEMLFIIIHQAYELWFKQLLFEVESVAAIFQQPAINDSSPELHTAVERIRRVNTIMQVLVQHMDIMETMTPLDFLDFRDMLRPASGFQSWQFKVLEARLGLAFDRRFGQAYYTSALRPEYVLQVKEAEEKPALLFLLDQWLARMPFFNDAALWQSFELQADPVAEQAGPFWQTYRRVLAQSLMQGGESGLAAFDQVMGFAEPVPGRRLSAGASRSALFIMLYAGYPLLQVPFHMMQAVMELDQWLSTWRYRHMNMVHRMIGQRVGTGGSTGKDYLKGAADSHYIFGDFAALTSFLVQRNLLPQLPAEIERLLGFAR